MPSEQSLQKAAQAWCTPETSGIEMDSRLAGAFARILDNEVPEPPIEFRVELQGLINRYSRENGSNTPDFVLADYVIDCLRALDMAMQSRDRWYDRGDGKFGVRVEIGSVTAPTIS